MATRRDGRTTNPWVSAVLHVAVALAYVALGWLGTRVGMTESGSTWYPAAGFAIAVLVTHDLRTAPALVVGELMVLLVLRPTGSDADWFALPQAIAYIAVYAVAARALSRSGATSAEAGARRTVQLLVVGGLVAPMVAALITVVGPLVTGTVAVADLPVVLGIRALAEGVGVASVAITVTVALVRWQRRGRWWALPETPIPLSVGLALLPASAALGISAATGELLPYGTILFVPVLAIAMTRGVSAIALSAPITAIAVLSVSSDRLASGPTGQAQVQLMLLLLLSIGLCAGLVTEHRGDLALRLAERQRHLDQAQLQAGAGSFVWKVPDDEVTWSDGLYALLGVEHGPILRDQYLEHVHPDDRAWVAEQLDGVLASAGSVSATYRVLRTDGVELVLRAHVEARSSDGRVVELIGSCFDVSAEERSRSSLVQAVARERDAAESRRLADELVVRTKRVKDALLVAVSHEVRTPLTIVRGVAETLLRSELAETSIADHQRSLQSLDRHARRLETVLLDLLDVDRIGRGVLTLTTRPTDLRPLLADVLEPLRLTIPLRIDVPSQELQVDARLAGRILEHLVANAARHSPPGRQVTVRATVEGDTLQICVDDEGPGIPEHERERIFEAFEQTTVMRHSPRTGVGLFLVASYAQLHGGRAWVTDGPDGLGTTFHATLMLGAPSANCGPPAA